VPKTWTHAELVDRAGRWLRNSARTEPPDLHGNLRITRCGVVLLEQWGGCENPDAIGWYTRGYQSILIECKTSRTDFRADKAKWVRRANDHSGMGRYRFYMAPTGIISPADLDESGWGLLVVDGRKVHVAKWSREFKFFAAREMEMLWSALRKCQAKPLNTKG